MNDITIPGVGLLKSDGKGMISFVPDEDGKTQDTAPTPTYDSPSATQRSDFDRGITVKFKDPPKLIPGFVNGMKSTANPFDLFAAGDPLLNEFKGKTVNPSSPVLQSFRAEPVINVMGKYMTRSQVLEHSAGKALLDRYDKISSGKRRGWIDNLLETNPATLLPFGGTLATVGEVGAGIRNAHRAASTFDAVMKGEAVSDDDLVATAAYIADQNWRSTSTFMSDVTDVVKIMPGLCMSFGVMGKTADASVKALAKTSPAVAKRVVLKGAMRQASRETSNILTTSLRTLANPASTGANVEAARSAISELSPKLAKLLYSSKDAGPGVLSSKRLKGLIDATGKLTLRGKKAVARSAADRAISLSAAGFAESAESGVTAARIIRAAGKSDTGKIIQLVNEAAGDAGTDAAKSVAAKAVSSITKMADDAAAAGKAADLKTIQTTALNAVSKMSGLSDEAVMAKAAALTYARDYVNAVNGYMDKPLRGYAVKTLWWASDHAMRGLTEHGDNILDVLPLTSKATLADAIGTLFVDAPVKGALYSTMHYGVRSAITALATKGDYIRPVNDTELQTRFIALQNNDPELMDRAVFMGIMGDVIENISESTGAGFGKLVSSTVGKFKSLDNVAWRAFKFKNPNAADTMVNRAYARAHIVRNMIDSYCGTSIGNATRNLELQRRTVERVFRNKELMKRTFKDKASSLTVDMIMSNRALKEEALKAGKKIMAHHVLLGTALRDGILANLGGNKLFGTGNLLSPVGIRRFFKKLSLDGTLGEMAEERYGDFVNALFNTDPETIGKRGSVHRSAEDAFSEITYKWAFPGWEQLGVELISFAIPGVMAHYANKAQAALGTGSLSRYNELMDRKRQIQNYAQAVVDTAENQEELAQVREAVQRMTNNTPGSEELDNQAASVHFSDEAIGVDLQTSRENTFKGANIQAPVSGKTIEDWTKDYISAVRDYNTLLRDIQFNNNMSTPAKVLHKIIGFMSFGLTGNFSAMSYDPILAMARAEENGEGLLRNGSLVYSQARNRAMADALSTVDDATRDALENAGAISYVTGIDGKQYTIFNPGKMPEAASKAIKDLYSTVEKNTDKLADTLLRSLVKNSFVSEGALRVTLEGDIADAAKTLTSSIITPDIENSIKDDSSGQVSKTINYVDPLGNEQTVTVTKQNLESVKKNLEQANRINLATRFLMLAKNGTIKYAPPANHGEARLASTVYTLNDAEYSGDKTVVAYQHQLDALIASMSGLSDVSMALRLDTIDASIMDEMKRYGTPLDMDTINGAAEFDLSLLDSKTDDELQNDTKFSALVRMMNRLKVVHVNNPAFIRPIAKHGVRLAKILAYRFSNDPRAEKTRWVIGEGMHAKPAETSSVLNEETGKYELQVRFRNSETNKVEVVKFHEVENNGAKEWVAVSKNDEYNGHNIDDVMTGNGYRKSTFNVVFAPTSLIRVSDPLVAVLSFGALSEKFKRDKTIVENVFKKLNQVRENPISGSEDIVTAAFDTMDSIRAMREIALAYGKDPSQKQYASTTMTTEGEETVPLYTVTNASAKLIASAIREADAYAQKAVAAIADRSDLFGNTSGDYLIRVSMASDTETVVVPFDPNMFNDPSAALVHEVIMNRLFSYWNHYGSATSQKMVDTFGLDDIMLSFSDTVKDLIDDIDRDNAGSIDAAKRARNDAKRAMLLELNQNVLAGGVPGRRALGEIITNIVLGYGDLAMREGNQIARQGTWGLIADRWANGKSRDGSDNLTRFRRLILYTATIMSSANVDNALVAADQMDSIISNVYDVFGAPGVIDWYKAIEDKAPRQVSAYTTPEASATANPQETEEGAPDPVPPATKSQEEIDRLNARIAKLTLKISEQEAAVAAAQANLDDANNRLSNGEQAAVTEIARYEAEIKAANDLIKTSEDEIKQLKDKIASGEQGAKDALTKLTDEIRNAVAELGEDGSMVDLEDAIKAINRKFQTGNDKGGNVIGVTNGPIPKTLVNIGDGIEYDVDTFGTRSSYANTEFYRLTPAAQAMVINSVLPVLSSALGQNALPVDTDEAVDKVYSLLMSKDCGYIGCGLSKSDVSILLAVKAAKELAASGRAIEDINKELKDSYGFTITNDFLKLVGANGRSEAAGDEEDGEEGEGDGNGTATDGGGFGVDGIREAEAMDEWQAMKFLLSALFPITRGNMAAIRQHIASMYYNGGSKAPGYEGLSDFAKAIVDACANGPDDIGKNAIRYGNESIPKAGVKDDIMFRVLHSVLSAASKVRYNKCIATLANITRLAPARLDSNYRITTDGGRVSKAPFIVLKRIAAEIAGSNNIGEAIKRLAELKHDVREDMIRTDAELFASINDILSSVSGYLGEIYRYVAASYYKSYGLTLKMPEGYSLNGMAIEPIPAKDGRVLIAQRLRGLLAIGVFAQDKQLPTVSEEVRAERDAKNIAKGAANRQSPMSMVSLVADELTMMLQVISKAGVNDLESIPTLVSYFGSATTSKANEMRTNAGATSTVAVAGAVDLLLSQYSRLHRTGRLTNEAGRTTELNKASLSITQASVVVPELVRVTSTASSVNGGVDDATRKRFAVWSDGSPMFTHVIEGANGVTAQELVGSMHKAMEDYGDAVDTYLREVSLQGMSDEEAEKEVAKAVRSIPDIHFVMYSGDRPTFTTLRVPAIEFLKLLYEADKAELDKSFFRPANYIDMALSLGATFTKESYDSVYNYLSGLMGLDQIDAKRTQLPASEQVRVNLKYFDKAGNEHAPKMAVYMSVGENDGSSDNETMFGSGMVFSPTHGERSIMRGFVPDDANTAKVHMVYVNPVTGIMEMVKGNFALNRGAKYIHEGWNAIMREGDGLADKFGTNLVMSDFDGVKVGPLAMKASSTGPVIVKVNGEAKTGKIGAILRPFIKEFKGKNNRVPSTQEINEAFTVTYNGKGYTLFDAQGEETKGPDAQGQETEKLGVLMPGATITEMTDGNDIIISYDTPGMTALLAANLYHKSSLERKCIARNNAIETQAIVSLAGMGEYASEEEREQETTAAKTLSNAMSGYSSLMALLSTLKSTGDDILARDAELAARFYKAPFAYDVNNDLMLRMNAETAKRMRVFTYRFKGVLMSPMAKGKNAENRSGLYRNCFFTRNSVDGELGFCMANVDDKRVRYGLFTTNETAKKVIDEQLQKKLSSMYANQAMFDAIISDGSISDTTRLLKLLQLMEVSPSKDCAIKGKYTTEGRSIRGALLSAFTDYSGRNLGSSHAEILFGDLGRLNNTATGTIQLTDSEYESCQKMVNGLPQKGKALYIPGSILTFPRTPSYNAGPVFTSLRLSAPVTVDQSGDAVKIGGDSLIIPCSEAEHRLGADNDGDTAMSMFPFFTSSTGAMVALYGESLSDIASNSEVKVFASVLSKLSTVGAKSIIKSALDGQGSIEERVEKVVSSLGKRLNDDERMMVRSLFTNAGKQVGVSQRIRELAAAITVASFNVLSANRSKYLGEDFGVRPLDLTADNEIVTPSGETATVNIAPVELVSGGKLNLRDPMHAARIMDSARAASKSRGAVVAQCGSLHTAARYQFSPNVLINNDGKLTAGLEIAGTGFRFNRLMRQLDLYANALFDDLKEQLAYRIRLTPDTTEMFVGMVAYNYLAEGRTHADTLNDYLTMIDGEVDKRTGQRTPMSGVIGFAAKYALGGSEELTGEQAARYERTKALAKNLKREGVYQVLSELGVVDERADSSILSSMLRNKMIAAVIAAYASEEDKDTKQRLGDCVRKLCRGAYFMAAVNAFSNSVSVYKAEARRGSIINAIVANRTPGDLTDGDTRVNIMRPVNGNLKDSIGTIPTDLRDQYEVDVRAVHDAVSASRGFETSDAKIRMVASELSGKVVGSEDNIYVRPKFKPIDTTADSGVGYGEKYEPWDDEPYYPDEEPGEWEYDGEETGFIADRRKTSNVSFSDLQSRMQRVPFAISCPRSINKLLGNEAFDKMNQKFISAGASDATTHDSWMIGVEAAYMALRIKMTNAYSKLEDIRANIESNGVEMIANINGTEVDTRGVKSDDGKYALTLAHIDRMENRIISLFKLLSSVGMPGYTLTGDSYLMTKFNDMTSSSAITISDLLQYALGDVTEGNPFDGLEEGVVDITDILQASVNTSTNITVQEARSSAANIRGTLNIGFSEQDSSLNEETISLRELMLGLLMYATMTTRTKSKADLGAASITGLLKPGMWDKYLGSNDTSTKGEGLYRLEYFTNMSAKGVSDRADAIKRLIDSARTGGEVEAMDLKFLCIDGVMGLFTVIGGKKGSGIKLSLNRDVSDSTINKLAKSGRIDLDSLVKLRNMPAMSKYSMFDRMVMEGFLLSGEKQRTKFHLRDNGTKESVADMRGYIAVPFNAMSEGSAESSAGVDLTSSVAESIVSMSINSDAAAVSALAKSSGANSVTLRIMSDSVKRLNNGSFAVPVIASIDTADQYKITGLNEDGKQETKGAGIVKVRLMAIVSKPSTSELGKATMYVCDAVPRDKDTVEAKPFTVENIVSVINDAAKSKVMWAIARAINAVEDKDMFSTSVPPVEGLEEAIRTGSMIKGLSSKLEFNTDALTDEISEREKLVAELQKEVAKNAQEVKKIQDTLKGAGAEAVSARQKLDEANEALATTKALLAEEQERLNQEKAKPEDTSKALDEERAKLAKSVINTAIAFTNEGFTRAIDAGSWSDIINIKGIRVGENENFDELKNNIVSESVIRRSEEFTKAMLQYMYGKGYEELGITDAQISQLVGRAYVSRAYDIYLKNKRDEDDNGFKKRSPSFHDVKNSVLRALYDVGQRGGYSGLQGLFDYYDSRKKSIINDLKVVIQEAIRNGENDAKDLNNYTVAGIAGFLLRFMNSYGNVDEFETVVPWGNVNSEFYLNTFPIYSVFDPSTQDITGIAKYGQKKRTEDGSDADELAEDTGFAMAQRALIENKLINMFSNELRDTLPNDMSEHMAARSILNTIYGRVNPRSIYTKSAGEKAKEEDLRGELALRYNNILSNNPRLARAISTIGEYLYGVQSIRSTVNYYNGEEAARLTYRDLRGRAVNAAYLPEGTAIYETIKRRSEFISSQSSGVSDDDYLKALETVRKEPRMPEKVQYINRPKAVDLFKESGVQEEYMMKVARMLDALPAEIIAKETFPSAVINTRINRDDLISMGVMTGKESQEAAVRKVNEFKKRLADANAAVQGVLNPISTDKETKRIVWKAIRDIRSWQQWHANTWRPYVEAYRALRKNYNEWLKNGGAEAREAVEKKLLAESSAEPIITTPFDFYTPEDDLDRSITLMDPVMAMKHFTLPSYGSYDLRSTVKFSSGQEVITEGIDTARYIEVLLGINDPVGRIARYKRLTGQSEFEFKDGAFTFTGKNGERDVFILPEQKRVRAWGANETLTDQEMEMARLVSRAYKSYCIGGSNFVYTGIGNASYGSSLRLSATDFGEKDNRGGIKLFDEAEFKAYYSQENVLNRHRAAMQGAGNVSAMTYWLQGVYSRIPDAILNSGLKDSIIKALWEAGKKYFGEANSWNPIIEGTTDADAARALTNAAEDILIKNGIMKQSEVKDRSGRKLTTLVIPVSTIMSVFKNSSYYEKLRNCGRTEEMLSLESMRGLVAPVIKRMNDYRQANPDLFMGDSAAFSGFGSNMWLTGNGTFSSAAALKEQWTGKSLKNMTSQEMSAALSFAQTLHFKHGKPMFIAVYTRNTGVKYKLNGARIGGGLIDMYNDVASDGKPLDLNGTYTEEEVKNLGFSTEDTIGDLAGKVYRGVMRKAYISKNSGIAFNKYRKDGLNGVATVEAFVKGYDMSDIGSVSRVARPNGGMTLDDAFTLEGTLPTDAGIGSMLQRLSLSIADACSFNGALHSMASTMSVEGLPNYLFVPTEQPMYGESMDDRMYAQLALFYQKAFGLGSGYNSSQSGRDNLRRVVSEVKQRMKSDFSVKYARLEDDSNTPGSGSLTGIQEIYCFVPEKRDANGVVVKDDANSILTKWPNKGSEAYGYMKKLCWIKAGVYDRNSRGFVKTMEAIHGFAKSMNVWGSLFFTIATRFESPIAASGLLNTILGQSDRMSEWAHRLEAGNTTDVMNNIGTVMDKLLFGGSTPSEWGLGGGAPMFSDIIKMMNTNDPTLIHLKELARLCGVTISEPGESFIVENGGKNTDTLISNMADKIAETVAKLNPLVGETNAKKYRAFAEGFLRGVSVDARERAFTYVMNATKLACVAQVLTRLRNEAYTSGVYFDPVKELRKVGNYINEEVGGIDPLAHAFDTPTMRSIMNSILFSWQWTMGSWSAGGGTLLTNAVLGGNATNAKLRGMVLGRWLRMFGWCMYGAPFMLQIISNAFAKGLWMLAGEPPENLDVTWFMFNNETVGRFSYDMFPLLKALAKLDENKFGGKLAGLKLGYAKKVATSEDAMRDPRLKEGDVYYDRLGGLSSVLSLTVGPLIPIYTGEGRGDTGQRHSYQNFAKQGWEFARWFTDPIGQAKTKTSPWVQWVVTQIAGADTFGNPVGWARETGFSVSDVTSLAWNVFSPFSVNSVYGQGTNDVGILSAVGPVKKGLGQMKGKQILEQNLRRYIDDVVVSNTSPRLLRAQANISEVLTELQNSGYNPKVMLDDARSKVLSDLYSEFYSYARSARMIKSHEQKLLTVARKLRALGVGREQAKQSALQKMRRIGNRSTSEIRRSPEYKNMMKLFDQVLGDNVDAWKKGIRVSTRQAMKAGASGVFGDAIPKSIFGAPVDAKTDEVFDDNRSAGYYEMKDASSPTADRNVPKSIFGVPVETKFSPFGVDGRTLTKSVFGIPVTTGDETGHSGTPMASKSSLVPDKIFGVDVVMNNRSWKDRTRKEASFYSDTREFLAQDDTPESIFGVRIDWQDHPLFTERPSIPGFYETGNEAQRAMKRRDVKSVFGIPVKWDGDDDDPDDPPPGGGLPTQAADEGGNVSDSQYVDNYEYGVNLALGHADDTYEYAGYTDDEIDKFVSNKNLNSNIDIPQDDTNFRTPTSALAGREDEFILWARRNMTEGERQEGYGRDYDYVGAFLAGAGRDQYGNGHLTDDYKLPNHPSFNPEAVLARFKKAGKTDEGVEYIRRALSKDLGINPKQWVARSLSSKPLKVFVGYEDDRYQSNDFFIRRSTFKVNHNPKKLIGLTDEQVKEWRAAHPDGIDPSMIKSLMITETGGLDAQSKAAFAADPLQVNVSSDDWSDYKADLGLTKPTARNEGDLENNILAAIRWLMRKGYGRSGVAPKDAVRPQGRPATYDGFNQAVLRYHGETQIGADRYLGNTLLRYDNDPDEGMIQPGKIKHERKKKEEPPAQAADKGGRVSSGIGEGFNAFEDDVSKSAVEHGRRDELVALRRALAKRLIVPGRDENSIAHNNVIRAMSYGINKLVESNEPVYPVSIAKWIDAIEKKHPDAFKPGTRYKLPGEYSARQQRIKRYGRGLATPYEVVGEETSDGFFKYRQDPAKPVVTYRDSWGGVEYDSAPENQPRNGPKKLSEMTAEEREKLAQEMFEETGWLD